MAEDLNEVELIPLEAVWEDPITHSVLLNPVLLELPARQDLDYLHEIEHDGLRRCCCKKVHIQQRWKYSFIIH